MSAITHANDRGAVRRAQTRATRAVELVTRVYGDRCAGDKEAAENSPLLCMVYSVAAVLLSPLYILPLSKWTKKDIRATSADKAHKQH